jgi:hypothetical protein
MISYLVDLLTKRKVFIVLKNPLKWVAGFGRWVRVEGFLSSMETDQTTTTQKGTTTTYFPHQI